jgi:hypothetical protein
MVVFLIESHPEVIVSRIRAKYVRIIDILLKHLAGLFLPENRKACNGLNKYQMAGHCT